MMDKGQNPRPDTMAIMAKAIRDMVSLESTSNPITRRLTINRVGDTKLPSATFINGPHDLHTWRVTSAYHLNHTTLGIS